jgi:opacity protein-like surface antigen
LYQPRANSSAYRRVPPMINLIKSVLISALIGSVSFAQTSTTPAQKAQDEKVWIEFGVPIAKNGPFKTAIDEQILKTGGISLSGGWQPMVNTDGGIMGSLKNFGIVFGGSSNLTNPFNDYKYTSEKHVTDVDTACYSHDSYSDRDYWDDSCYRCTYGHGYCQDDAVYGRNRYVKYETGTLFLGAFVPVQVADRLRLEGGANFRAHFISEGIIDNDLRSTTEGSLGLIAGAAFQVNRNVALTGSYEYSVKGRKYKAYQFGVRWNLGRYF